MDFQTLPFYLKVEFLLQLFDDALADVAEGSDVIGKNRNADAHVLTYLNLLQIHL
jgi:hypothetical protein